MNSNTDSAFYRVFFLDDKESLNMGVCSSWNYVKNNESRWVNIDEFCQEIPTYDKGNSSFIYNNELYFIYRDYLDINEKQRVYVGVKRFGENDKYIAGTTFDIPEN